MTATTDLRLTQYARGGGCACKIPPGELEDVLTGLRGAVGPGVLVGLDDGDDAAAIRLGTVRGGDPGTDAGGLPGGLPGTDAGGLLDNLLANVAVLATADFFTPVVDDPYDWGRIAAANALSDIYAMGGRPLVAVNLLSWPRELLSQDVLREVLRGGLDVARTAGCFVGGGHSVDDAEPKYGMAVTGIADARRLLRNDAGRAGQPLSLTKPLGIGVLNSRHKSTGEVFPHAVETMAALNRDASVAALAAGISCATDVTGFGLLGHLHKLARASGVTARVDPTAVPYLDGAREAAEAGYVSGGTRRNLAWVAPHADLGRTAGIDQLLLADAQTSGGLLVAGEIPGAAVVGELLPARDGVTLVVG